MAALPKTHMQTLGGRRAPPGPGRHQGLAQQDDSLQRSVLAVVRAGFVENVPLHAQTSIRQQLCPTLIYFKSNKGKSNFSVWLLLPAEVWLCIFSLLSRKELARIAQVCHRFHRLARDELFSKYITISGLRPILNVTSCSGHVLRKDTILPHANIFCKELTSVDSSWAGSTDLGIISLAEASFKVRDIVVHFIVTQCPKLEYSVFSSSSQVTDKSLVDFTTYLQMINSSHNISRRRIQAFAGSCRQLHYLALSSTATSKREVCLLASFCVSLERVELNFCRNVTLDAMKELCNNCKKLKMLHLYGFYFNHGLESIKEINKTVKVFHNLTVPTANISVE
ncbi:LOW QUALITY PROTEIN: uncharacterized protein FYN12_014112 [Phoenicopterus ruber ruber]